MYDQRVVRSQFVAELPDGFDVRQRFDVADRAADLGDDNVIYFLGAQQLDSPFDFVGDVRDDLHGLAEEFAAPFFVDNALVDASGGDVVGL